MCYEKWARREGREAARREWRGRNYLYGQYGIRVRILHCVVSLVYTGQTLEEAKDQARRIARKHGLRGGCLISHPFRSPDDGEWANDGTIHFHISGMAGKNIEESKEVQGYMFKVIPDREHHDYRGVRSEAALARLITYQLTHCGIWDKRHAITWWGELSYNKLPGKKLEEFDQVEDPMSLGRASEYGPKCPYCGSTETESCYQWDRCECMKTQVHRPPDTEPPSWPVPPPRLRLDATFSVRHGASRHEVPTGGNPLQPKAAVRRNENEAGQVGPAGRASRGGDS